MNRPKATAAIHVDGRLGVPPLSADLVPSRPIVAVTTLLVAFNLAIFLALGEDVLNGGDLVSHDESVLTWFVDHRTDSLVSLAKLASTAGGFACLLIVGIGLALWLWRQTVHVVMATAPAVSLVLGSLASTAAKAAFGRDRPPQTVHATTVTLAAFPSGHATDGAAFFLAAAFILAITVAHRRVTQLLLGVGGSVLAAVVGVSRLVLGVHWLSDVIAGWTLGAAVAIIVVTTTWYFVAPRHEPGAVPPT
jgi:undecaprenyl-diphosphatase